MTQNTGTSLHWNRIHESFYKGCLRDIH